MVGDATDAPDTDEYAESLAVRGGLFSSFFEEGGPLITRMVRLSSDWGDVGVFTCGLLLCHDSC